MTNNIAESAEGEPVAGISWDDQKTSATPLKRSTAAGVVAAVAVAFLPAAAPANDLEVIVRAAPDAIDQAVAAVERAGGQVTDRFEVIEGFAAVIPSSASSFLVSGPSIAAITPDTTLVAHSTSDPNGIEDARSVRSSATALGVDEFWARGVDGSGVDVAIIDSGVASSPAFGTRLSYGPDLSFESESDDTRHTDTFGHGTHLAGIIAGSHERSGFTGVAPGAGLVSVKVADRNGVTDVSQVIAAIDWVVEHRNANGMNIRVLNLAFGTNGAQDHTLDPLAYAAQAAWRSGIVVVVAAGNEGVDLGRLNNPASDPNILAVGAADIVGTATTTDDRIPSWSSRGDGVRNPDVVAPGVSVISVKAKGSRAAENHPSAHVGTHLIKGSGTSQAAAFTAGVAALMIDRYPKATPDQIKAALTSTAAPIRGASSTESGAGLIQPVAAVKSGGNAKIGKHVWGRGTGTLDASRGDARITRDGHVLEGEHSVFGEWSSEKWVRSAGSTWSGSTWSGSTWSGGAWLGSTWSGSTWSGSTWSGSTWSGSTWSGSTWSGSTWSGSTWSGSTWSTASWG